MSPPCLNPYATCTSTSHAVSLTGVQESTPSQCALPLNQVSCALLTPNIQNGQCLLPVLSTCHALGTFRSLGLESATFPTPTWFSGRFRLTVMGNTDGRRQRANGAFARQTSTHARAGPPGQCLFHDPTTSLSTNCNDDVRVPCRFTNTTKVTSQRLEDLLPSLHIPSSPRKSIRQS